MDLHGKMKSVIKWNDLTFLGKNLQLLQKEEKQNSKQTTNENEHKTKTYLWFLTQNMANTKLLSYANSKLEFGEIPSTWKWMLSSYLKRICTLHGIHLDKCAITSHNMHGNSKISMNWWESLKMSTYLEAKEPK